MRIKNFVKDNRYIGLTFGIAFIIMMAAFAIIGLYPFGDQQIMVIDSWHQYYPFLQELHTKLTSGGSLFYSWNIGGGINFFLVMAYYAMSPLYLLSVLFSQTYLREFMMLITAVKIALAGTFFSIYLRKMFNRDDIFITLFGLMYAFSAFAMGYYWDIMWLDNMALLPLIILGFHQVFEEKGFLLYVVTLALAMISNFYIGYFICEFIIIYAIFTYLKSHSVRKLSVLGSKIFTVLFYSVLGLGLAAITVIPTYEGIGRAYATASGNPKSIEFYFTFVELFNALLANVPPSIRSGLPNINSGFLALILLLIYFGTKQIRLRERLLNLGMLAVFMLILTLNYLDFAFHAFHFPNEVPHRFAFMVSFLIITWAYEAFLHSETLSANTLWKLFIGFFAYILLTEHLNPELDYKLVIFSSLILLALYASVFLLRAEKKITVRGFTIALTAIVIVQVTSSAIVGAATTGSSSRESYAPKKEKIESAMEAIAAEDSDFYRMEMIMWYSTNDSAIYGYHGMSTFTSTANAPMSYLTQALGLAAAPEANRYIYASSTPVVNSLFNIKYLIDRIDTAYYPNAAFRYYDTFDDMDVYKSDYPLSLGFMVDDDIDLWDLTAKNPFKTQDAFLSAATGEEVSVFDFIEASSAEYTNMNVTETNTTYRTYKLTNSSQVGKVHYTYIVPETDQIYLYMFTHLTDDAYISVNGEEETYETKRGLVIDLGIQEAGSEIVVDFEVPENRNSSFYINAVSFDEEAFQAAYETFADELFEMRLFSDTHVEGVVEAKEDGRLLMSIPYEPGWTATVDGEAAEIIPINDALISIELPAGTHRVVLDYTPAGFKSGLIISLISLLLVAGIFITDRRKTKNQHKKSETEETEEIEGTRETFEESTQEMTEDSPKTEA